MGEGKRYVRVSLRPDFEAALYEDGSIEIIFQGVHYSFEAILRELILAWERHYERVQD